MIHLCKKAIRHHSALIYSHEVEREREIDPQRHIIRIGLQMENLWDSMYILNLDFVLFQYLRDEERKKCWLVKSMKRVYLKLKSKELLD